MENYFPSVVVEDLLEALVDEDAPFDGCVVALLKEPPPLSPDTEWADLEEANFSGYARSSALTFGSPYTDAETGMKVVSAPMVEFLSTTADPFVSNQIYGHALIVPGTPPTLRSLVAYDAPVSIDAPDLVHGVRVELGLVPQQAGNTVLAG